MLKNLDEVKTKYPFNRSPNLSRMTRFGISAESTVEEIENKVKHTEHTLRRSHTWFGAETLTYFPKYDIYLLTSSSRFWCGTTFYTKNEKGYKKFWSEVVRPVTQKLWR